MPLSAPDKTQPYARVFKLRALNKTNTPTMNNKSEVTMNNPSNVLNLISWLFAIVFFAIGFVNTFWGNDAGFGIFIILLSLAYVPPLNAMFRQKTGLAVPAVLKVLLAIFIIWAALGVGELFDKIDLMMGFIPASARPL